MGVEGRGRWWERVGKEGDRCGRMRKVVGKSRKRGWCGWKEEKGGWRE